MPQVVAEEKWVGYMIFRAALRLGRSFFVFQRLGSILLIVLYWLSIFVVDNFVVTKKLPRLAFLFSPNLRHK